MLLADYAMFLKNLFAQNFYTRKDDVSQIVWRTFGSRFQKCNFCKLGSEVINTEVRSSTPEVHKHVSP